MRLIQSITATGSSNTFSFTDIPQDYDDLMIFGSVRDSATGLLANYGAAFSMALNATAGTGKLIKYQGTVAGENFTFAAVVGWMPDGNQTANTFGNARIYIPNYKSTLAKIYSFESVSEDQRSIVAVFQGTGLINTTLPVTSLSLGNATSGANFVSGSVVSLYGITKGSGFASVS
jgi:hypothetical protein